MGTDTHSCLLLLSTLIALTAEAFPANRRIMPSPFFRHRPTTLLYPHRKLSRPWLLKLQEELWKDGPSGDGPEEDGFSTLLPFTESRLISESNYKIHSPSAEDFSDDAVPFPTVIDTMMDESPFFGTESISRTSVPYEGPSSLLNSFIFKPSLPFFSPSSTKTPRAEESSGMDSGNIFPFSLLDESSMWKMSPRQAVSETISNPFVIITAISAKHIFSENEWTSSINSNPSSIPPLIFPSVFIPEETQRTPKTASDYQMPSPPLSKANETPVTYSEGRFFYISMTNPFLLTSHQLDYKFSFGNLHPTLAFQIFSSSSEIPMDHLNTAVYLDTWNRTEDLPYIVYHNYSSSYISTSFLDLSPSDSAIDIDRGLLSTHTMKSSFFINTNVFYDFINTSFYMIPSTLLINLLTNNVLTTVTAVENKRSTENFIMPTLTVQGLPPTATNIHSDDSQELKFSSSQRTAFPHISSSFTDFSDVIPIISLWPLDGISPAGSMRSHEETKTYFQENSRKSAGPFRRSGPGFEDSHPMFTVKRTPFLNNEITDKDFSFVVDPTKFKMEISSENVRHTTVNLEQTHTLKDPQMLTFTTTDNDMEMATGRESWMNELETNQTKLQSADLIPDDSFFSFPKSTYRTESSTHMTSILNLTTKSSRVYGEKNSSIESLSSKRASTGSYQSQQEEMTLTIASGPEVIPTADKIKEIPSLTQLRSATESIDLSTHHVTVRSLRDDEPVSVITESTRFEFTTGDGDDIIPELTSSSEKSSSSPISDTTKSIQFEYTADDGDDIISEFTSSLHTLTSPIITRSDVPEDLTKSAGESTSLPKMYTRKRVPKTSENNFMENGNLNETMSLRSTWFSTLSSGPDRDFYDIMMSTRQPLKSEIDHSLTEKELTDFPFLPSLKSHSYPLMHSFFEMSSEQRRDDRVFTTKNSGSIESTAIFSLTKTVFPENTIHHLQSDKIFEDSLKQFPTSFYHSASRYKETVGIGTFGTVTVTPIDQSFISQLESLSAYSESNIKPSKTFPDTLDKNELKQTVTTRISHEYELSDSDSVNEFMKRPKSSYSEIKIESSMILPHLGESIEISQTAPFVITSLASATKPLYESMTFSPKGYLSENLFHSSNVIETSKSEMILSLLSPTSIGDASRRMIYSTSEVDESDKSSDVGGTLLEEASYSFPVLRSPSVSSKHFMSEKSSSRIPEFAHDIESDMMNSSYYFLTKLVPSYSGQDSSYLEKTVTSESIPSSIPPIFPTNSKTSSLLLTPTVYMSKIFSKFMSSPSENGLFSSFPSNLLESSLAFKHILLSEDEFLLTPKKTSDQVRNPSATDVLYSSKLESSSVPIALEKTPIHSITHIKSRGSDELESRVYSRYPESSMDFVPIYTSKDESYFDQHVRELTASKILILPEKSSLIERASQHKDLNNLESFSTFTTVFTSEEESFFQHHSEELTANLQSTTLKGFSSIDISHPEFYSSPFQKPSRSISNFVSEHSSKIFRQTPTQTVTTYFESYWIASGLRPSVSQGIVYSTLDFFSEKKSKHFDTLKLMPTSFTVMYEETASTSRWGSEGRFLTKSDTIHHESSRVFIADQTLFSPHIPKMTSVPPNVTHESFRCNGTSCSPIVQKTIIPIFSTTLTQDYVTISSILHSKLTSQQKVYNNASQVFYSSAHEDTQISQSSHFSKVIKTKSVELIHPTQKPMLTKISSLSTIPSSFQPQPATSFSTSISVASRLMPKSASAKTASSDTDATPAWKKGSSTPGIDIEMASVLAISSFIGVNASSRNTNSTLENGGISESDWSKAEVKPTPSMDLMLFKDNNYWILTVLEAPIKGQLPENFSQTLEQRFANAYSEAFRSRSLKQGPEEPVVVKILSLTNDLLLSQLDIVYVVERGGALVPASLASEFLNFLRHEQLREFLGLYAILKAKPYLPNESPESQEVSTAIPVVTIVCSTLAFLLLIFCCFCIYCRCCRPKQAEDDRTPTSSASGSLQRSLAKHGQHNRKHLFQEMTHRLTAEMISHRKQHESASVGESMHVDEKEPLPSGKKLPPLPPRDTAEAIDKATKMLMVLENKDASTSPIASKRSGDKEKTSKVDKNVSDTKILPKTKKRKTTKYPQEILAEKMDNGDIEDELRLAPSIPPKEADERAAIMDSNRASPDSGTSSRHTTSSTSEKTSEEMGSDSSKTELLPPLQDLIAKSKADSEAAAADTQIHLSRVRQRITELLDDAFALANGRKFNGSMRSKKIDPATDMFPRYSSLRSQSAAECSTLRQEDNLIDEKRRSISEGAQNLMGTITDDGQLITRPPPKLVWDHNETEDSTSGFLKHQEVTEAHNRHVNFFPFQQQSKLRQISASSTSSLPILDTLEESQVDLKESMLPTTSVLRETASDVYLAQSSKIHPAVADQYDEIDVVSALRDGEPVADLIRAIKDELQKFSGSSPGSNNYESHA